MKFKRPLLLFFLGLLSIYSVVGFFAYRAINNEHQAVQFATQQQSNKAAQYLISQIQQQLGQTQSQLSAITQFSSLQHDGLEQLIDKTPIIKNIFVIHQRQLQYPVAVTGQLLSRQEQQFITFIQPLINDPSLFMQAVATENQAHDFGWYYSQREQAPTLIYWQYKPAEPSPQRLETSVAELSESGVLIPKQSIDGQVLVGYELAYSVFRANVIAALDNQSPSGQFSLFENGQLLVTNQRQKEVMLNGLLTITKQLPYPLQEWSIRYTSTAAIADNRATIWFAVTALLAAITVAATLLYRETQRRIRLATQQVQFVSQISHELKTPLTNIRLYAEMLKENADASQSEYRYLSVITDETQRLTRLIQNVLNFNKPPRLNLRRVNYVDLLWQIEQSFIPHFASRGLTIRQKIASDIEHDDTIETDPDMLTQIINNLLSNAEKYAVSGRYVDIELGKTNSKLIIAVRDYGEGVSKAELKKLTQPFYRVNNHITEGVAGTGIGLTIAKQLADNMGAELRIEMLEKGMRFSLAINEQKKWRNDENITC